MSKDRERAILIQKTLKIAMDAFYGGLQQCTTLEECSHYCQTLCALTAKTIGGIEGNEIKRGFLEGAIADEETITPEKPH